ncbi:hypothetical protein EG68_07175 [Paragonimus skrjabini miyazakii]|uniref:Uncharacterized protein n=1 Tax=Paragonimus skrjabini miyazakii TaxID=59628 RepID=A0A8S9YM73_9TREM|nr:hypothetical protein EG68_07175 [Paragonimus skrjabini miyazakii]
MRPHCEHRTRLTLFVTPHVNCLRCTSHANGADHLHICGGDCMATSCLTEYRPQSHGKQVNHCMDSVIRVVNLIDLFSTMVNARIRMDKRDSNIISFKP